MQKKPNETRKESLGMETISLILSLLPSLTMEQLLALIVFAVIALAAFTIHVVHSVVKK